MRTAQTDQRLFRGSVDYYLKYRSHYPHSLVDAVAQTCGLESQARVLDLGSGPGILARSFAPLARETICVDPEPDMILAAKLYLQDFSDRVGFICASAEELTPEIGAFRLVAIGRAFHWMDRDSTLAFLETIVEPEGAVVLFRDPSLRLPENAWRRVFDEVYSDFANTDRAREGARTPETAVDEAHLLRSPFNRLDRISTVVVRDLTIDHAIGRAFSMAGTAPGDLGARREAFESAMRDALAPFLCEGRLTEITEPQALIARRATDLAPHTTERKSTLRHAE